MDIPFGKIINKFHLSFGALGKIQNKSGIEAYFGKQLIEDNSDREEKPQGRDDQGYRHDK
jgi:hypothetical protein